MKLTCEECSIGRANVRRLRPCRHWRWLMLGRMAPVRKIRIVTMTETIANGYVLNAPPLYDDSRMHWNWYSIDPLAISMRKSACAVHEPVVPASMNACAP